MGKKELTLESSPLRNMILSTRNLAIEATLITDYKWISLIELGIQPQNYSNCIQFSYYGFKSVVIYKQSIYLYNIQAVNY